MKKALAIILAITLVLALTACSGGEEPASTGGSEQEASTSFEVNLEGNATTGYQWIYEMSAEGVVAETLNEYLDGNAEGTVGAGGTFHFVFESVAPGEVTLNFIYARPWESVQPLYTAYYVLTVDESLNVICTESGGSLPAEEQ